MAAQAVEAQLAGFVLLWLVVIRLIYRFAHGAPPDGPTLEWWQKAGSHLTHWGLYGLLLAVPLLGWLGVTLFGALGTIGGFKLPAIPGQDALYQMASGVASIIGFSVPAGTAEAGAKAKLVFALHFWGAMLMLLAIAAHVGAAIFHHFIRGDGVLTRQEAIGNAERMFKKMDTNGDGKITTEEMDASRR